MTSDFTGVRRGLLRAGAAATFLMFALGSAAPLPANAASACNLANFWKGECLNGPLVPDCSPASTGGDQCTLCHSFELIQNVTYFGMSLAVLILAPIMFIVGAFTIIVSRGSEQQVGRGRQIIWSALIGLAIVLGAWVIVNTTIYAVGIDLFEGSGGAWDSFVCDAG